MTATDPSRRTESAASPSSRQPQPKQHEPRGSTLSLAQQIRSFNQQQFGSAQHNEKASDDDEFFVCDASNDDNSSSHSTQQHSSVAISHTADNGVKADAKLRESAYDSDDDVDNDAFNNDDNEDDPALAMMSTLQLLQSRTVLHTSTSNHHHANRTGNNSDTAASTSMELHLAEERIALLEAQLLNAEETICHLQAEKRAARRDVERLAAALAQATQQDASIGTTNIWTHSTASASFSSPSTVVSPTDSNANDQQHLLLELETQRAVVRDQERQISELERALAHAQAQVASDDDCSAQLVRALARPSSSPLLSPLRTRATHGPEDALMYDQEDIHPEDSVAMWMLDDDRGRTSHHRKEMLRRRCYSSSLSLHSSDASSEDKSSDGSTHALLSPPRHFSTVEQQLAPHWREDVVRHPTPSFDLDSPEVHYLLTAWTANHQKLQYLRLWFTQVAGSQRKSLPTDVPLGVELPHLRPEICDGFRTLVVPLLRKQPHRDVVVHVRQRHNTDKDDDDERTDLRIRVVPRK